MSKHEEEFKEKMSEVSRKLEKVGSHLNSIDKTLIKQEANLEKHMMRTEQNETMIQMIAEAIKPVTKHVSQMEGAFKLLGVISLLGGIILTIAKVIGLF